MKRLDPVIKKYKKGELTLLEVLESAARSNNFISFDEMNYLSQKLCIPLAKLYGVATFYSFLPTTHCGRHIIRICGSPSCFLNGSKTLVEFLKEELKINLGETTNDGRFTLEKTSCLGQCDKSPAMMVKDKVYINLDEKKIRSILRGLK